MSLLAEIQEALSVTGIPVETGVYSGKAPDTYIVAVPMEDSLELYADDLPTEEVQEVRLSLFTKNNYTTLRDRLTHLLLENDLTITLRQYIGYETDTGYHHYVIDVAKVYEFEME